MTSEPAEKPRKLMISSVLIPLGIILAIIWGALTALKYQMAPRDSGRLELKVGATLPDLTFYQTDGKPFKLSDSTAEVILINFWATWCEACMEEMPSLVQLHNTYRSKGLEIYGVNLDEDPAKAIATTSKEFEIKFTSFLIDVGKLGDAYDVHAIPRTVTLNRSRKVLEIQAGDRDWMSQPYLKKLDNWLQGDQANR